MATVQETATSYPTSYTTNGNISGTRYQNAVGKGSNTTAVSGNDYANGSSSSTAYIAYAFDFGDIPSDATIDSVSCTVKGHAEDTSRSTCTLQLYAGTTAKGSSTKFTSTSAQTLTLTTGTWTAAEIRTMTLRFTIGYYGGLVNGATVTVTYTYNSVTYIVTSSLSGNGTISPDGETSMGSGETYELTITPTDSSDPVTATKDGADITSDLVAHYPGGILSAVLGTYSLKSGSFNGSGASYFQGLVGKGVDSAQTTSNYYSGGNNSNAVFQYKMAFTDIPSNATIERVYCEVNGHAESTSNSAEYMCVQLKSGSAELSAQINFKSVGTSNTTITLECTTLPTAAQLADMVLECTLGYYGGAINGATCYVVYSVPATHPEYYTYSFVVDGNATIAVVIDGSKDAASLWFKDGGVWVKAAAVFKKVNGSWVQQSDLTRVFASGTKYVKGGS